jgi:putative glutamine amidotransferase
MTKPVIGITAYGVNQNHRYDLPYGYVYAVRKAGGTPLLIAPGDKPNDYLHLFDGIILAGGGDIQPHFYDGKNHHTIYKTNEERDISEFELVKALLKAKTPLFAICRGLQVVNVLLGGTVYEHLPEHYGEKVLHRSSDAKQVQHKVEIEPGSLLADIVKTDEMKIASMHHQSIKNLASKLKITATAADGVIEAAEMPGHPWFLGVQWHPELTAANDPLQQHLFDAMIKHIKKNQLQT